MRAPGAGRGHALLALLVTALLAFAPPAAGEPPPPTPTPEGAPDRVVGEVGPEQPVAAGVVHQGVTTTAAAGQVMGDVVVVDLTASGIRADLLAPGTIAAGASVAAMADHTGAVAGINGDFFDIGRRSTSTPCRSAGSACSPGLGRGRPGQDVVRHRRRP